MLLLILTRFSPVYKIVILTITISPLLRSPFTTVAPRSSSSTTVAFHTLLPPLLSLCLSSASASPFTPSSSKCGPLLTEVSSNPN
ncbi:hypothetical protein Ahy_A02g008323 isoform K [Arachis hypogaea]|uniref:Uncharacterized protein n=1 Tax=Arachis hypogaea TaxID=3818 RepID=A0A445EEX8_ARAHY|nr:hypothetical protein Ahy_A02g008323 isoform K [Arachis hypogaea]